MREVHLASLASACSMQMKGPIRAALGLKSPEDRQQWTDLPSRTIPKRGDIVSSIKPSQQPTAPGAGQAPPIAAPPKAGKVPFLQGARQVLGPLACGLFLGVLPPLLIWLIADGASTISLSRSAGTTLDVILFAGALFLLFFPKVGSFNFRLGVEITVWLAAANALTFRFFVSPWAQYALVAVATVAAFWIAYARATVPRAQ